MKDEVLQLVIDRWELEAKEPDTEDGSKDAEIPNAVREGERQAKRECADLLRMLISQIGDDRTRA